MASNSDLLALIDALEGEHAEVRDALSKIDSAVASEDAVRLSSALTSGAELLKSGLDSHSSAEDDLLFPALAGTIGEGVTSVFVEEHIRIRSLRDGIYAALGRGEADFDGSGEFSELLRAHVDREEAMLFPSAKEVLAG